MNEITSDPEILGGVAVFTGTRVPVQGLFDCLEAGDSLGAFLQGMLNVRFQYGPVLCQNPD